MEPCRFVAVAIAAPVAIAWIASSEKHSMGLEQGVEVNSEAGNGNHPQLPPFGCMGLGNPTSHLYSTKSYRVPYSGPTLSHPMTTSETTPKVCMRVRVRCVYACVCVCVLVSVCRRRAVECSGGTGVSGCLRCRTLYGTLYGSSFSRMSVSLYLHTYACM